MDLDEWRSTPLIFVDDLEHPVLSKGDLHHFERVRRLSAGTPIVVADGKGAWRSAHFAPVPELTSDVNVEPAPGRPSTIGFTPVKGDRPEWVIQKLTELGVDVIRPLQTRRSVVRWDAARAAKQIVKWQNVAREAAMQSRRVRLPTILPVAPLEVAVNAGGVVPVFAEPGGVPLDPSVDRFVLIGPEGGWDEEELRGQQRRALPGGVLRAETAAVAAAVLLATSL